MDIWFTLGSIVGYVVIIVVVGLIVWSVYGLLKKIKNKLTKKE